MPIINKKLHYRERNGREDWYYLDYNTDTREFSINHQWHHMNSFRTSDPVREGAETILIEGYTGYGADKVEDAKTELLKEAGHDLA